MWFLLSFLSHPYGLAEERLTVTQYMPPPVFDRPPLPVLVSVAPPARQRRVTVAFRAILAIPHLVVLYVLGLVASIMAVIGWFAALFTGSIPVFSATFLAGYLRWYFRVVAYVLLLTDVYPPFTLDESEYPVRFAIQPGRLNRLAVFFRLVLLIPAAVVAFLLSYGIATIVLFVTWLIALITGRLPVSLHLALAAVLRFQVRYFGYGYLLTATYPTSGLFGDATGALGFGAEQLPDPWRLPLTGGAKRLLALFLALGLITVGGAGVAVAEAAGTAVNAATAAIQVDAAYQRLAQQLSATEAGQTACKQAAQPLPCIQAILKKMSGYTTTFDTSVRNTAMPANARPDQEKLVADGTAAARILNQLGTAKAAQYTSILNSSNLNGYLNGLDTESQALEQRLLSDGT
jgi:hypothetical protein